LFGEIGIARIAQLGKEFLRIFLGADQDFPDFVNNKLEEFEIALLGRDYALPIPLVNLGRMIMVKEVIFAYCAHVGADTFAWFTVELL
jgi:hypothetical protein